MALRKVKSLVFGQFLAKILFSMLTNQICIFAFNRKNNCAKLLCIFVYAAIWYGRNQTQESMVLGNVSFFLRFPIFESFWFFLKIILLISSLEFNKKNTKNFLHKQLRSKFLKIEILILGCHFLFWTSLEKLCVLFPAKSDFGSKGIIYPTY